MKIIRLVLAVFVIASITAFSCSGSKGSRRCQTCPKFSKVILPSKNVAS